MMTMAMLISCFAISTSVMAEEIPSITVGGASLSVTFPKNGSDEKSVKVAKFVPEETGWYEFECDALYTSTTSKKDELPGGVFAVDLYEENYFATQGMCFFADTSKLTEEQKAMYKEAGMSLDDMNRLITTALCEKGKTYYVTGYQDGTADYTANLTVKTHTHTIKADNEDKVKVNKDGTSNDAGGKYETCTCGYCNYMKYTENYYQIVSTTVKNAVYTGKAVKPAVKIETATGKKLNSKYYTVTYKNNKKVGKGTAIITFKTVIRVLLKRPLRLTPRQLQLRKLPQVQSSSRQPIRRLQA